MRRLVRPDFVLDLHDINQDELGLNAIVEVDVVLLRPSLSFLNGLPAIDGTYRCFSLRSDAAGSQRIDSIFDEIVSPLLGAGYVNSPNEHIRLLPLVAAGFAPHVEGAIQ